MRGGVNQRLIFGMVVLKERRSLEELKSPRYFYSPAMLPVTAADVLMICLEFNELEVECSVKCLFWWQFSDVST